MLSSEKILCFECTGCGGCCREHYLPLTLSEGLAWKESGGSLGLLVEMIPQTDFIELNENSDPSFLFRKARMFDSTCGQIDTFVNLEIVSVIEGDCVHLKENRCTHYDQRPSVCRVHPADILQPLDTFPLVTSHKKCPPEAWKNIPFMKGYRLLAATERERVSAFQEKQLQERPLLHHLSDILGINLGALMGQGTLVHPLDKMNFQTLVCEAKRRQQNQRIFDKTPWQLYVPSKLDRQRLKMRGLTMASHTALKDDMFFIIPTD